eukprot:gene429-461_t
MGGLFEGTEEHQVYVILNLITSIVGSAASLFTILLIHRMKVNTGHVLLVLTMSYFQLLYDLTFFFSNVVVTYYTNVFANFVQLAAGIAGSLVSNWIAFIALYIILYRRKFNIFNHYYYILASCLLPGIIDTVIYGIGAIPESRQIDDLIDLSILDIYYYVRLISILLNFIFIFIAFYKINLMSSTTLNKSPQEIAIRTLARRLIFYPIVQAIGRSGYAWYEFAYGYYIDMDDPNPEQYASLIFLTIVTPFVSIGYLIIFLAMQPRAYEEFRQMVYCSHYQPPTKESLDTQTNTQSSGRTRETRSDSNRLTVDTLSYYTDGGRDSEANQTESGEIELSMAEVARTSSATLKDLAQSGQTKFSNFEDEELLNFIVDSEKEERNSESTIDRPSLMQFFKGSKSIVNDNFANNPTTTPVNSRADSSPSLFQRTSTFLSGSITTTISGRNSLFSQFKNRNSAQKRASASEVSTTTATTTTENPLINTNAGPKRRSVNVLNSIDEEGGQGGRTKSRSDSKEPLRPISEQRSKSRIASTDTTVSTLTTKSGNSSNSIQPANPLSLPPLNTSSPKWTESRKGHSSSMGYYVRDSDFLADARESVDAFYQQQDSRESGYSEY